MKQPPPNPDLTLSADDQALLRDIAAQTVVHACGVATAEEPGPRSCGWKICGQPAALDLGSTHDVVFKTSTDQKARYLCEFHKQDMVSSKAVK